MTTDPKHPDLISDPDGRPTQQPTDVSQPEDQDEHYSQSDDHKIAKNPPRE